MELDISDVDAKALGLNSSVKEKLVELTHTYLGFASVVTVTLTEDPEGIKLDTAGGIVIVNREMTRRIDN
jgi:hypothetical protein